MRLTSTLVLPIGYIVFVIIWSIVASSIKILESVISFPVSLAKTSANTLTQNIFKGTSFMDDVLLVHKQ